MRTLRTFADVQAALAEIYISERTFKPGTHSSLESMVALMAALGNPHERLRVVHVAGTSGKTSTAYYTAALLHGCGFKVGLAVSPHVQAMNDRVQINMVPLPEALFALEMQEYLERVEATGLKVSFYKLMMGFVFWEFDRQQVDVAVVEVGLGGLLDSSNVAQRPDKVCVITDIGLDHTYLLGDTLPEIAAQKAGIIGLRNNVFCNRQSTEVMEVFQRRCQQQQASLHILGEHDHVPEADSLPLFQQRNYRLACATAEFVCQREGVPLTKRARNQAATLTFIPGRMETVRVGDTTLIVDGAHNEQKIGALMQSVRHAYPGQSIAALVAFSQGEDAEQRIRLGLKALRPHVSRLFVTGFSGEHDGPLVGVEPQELAKIAAELNFDHVQQAPSPEEGYEMLMVAPERLRLVLGSFYLLNHIRPLMRKK